MRLALWMCTHKLRPQRLWDEKDLVGMSMEPYGFVNEIVANWFGACYFWSNSNPQTKAKCNDA